MGLIFHKLHITENIDGVPNNLLYLQKVFKRYTLKQACTIYGLRAECCFTIA